MKNVSIGAAFLVVVGIAVYFSFSGAGPAASAICSNEVHGRAQSVKTMLGTAAKNLEEVRPELDREASSRYLDRLSATPTSLRALETLATQCKLLERCLSRAKSGSETCPAEYRDYRARVDASLQLVARVEEYEKETQNALMQAREIKKIRGYLWDVQNSGVMDAGDQGAAAIRKNLAAQRQVLAMRVKGIEDLAEKVLRASAPGTVEIPPHRSTSS